jgi:hypothetical protein
VFTRFIPPNTAADMPGKWQRYYQKWSQVTRKQLDASLLDLVPPLPDYVRRQQPLIANDTLLFAMVRCTAIFDSTVSIR